MKNRFTIAKTDPKTDARAASFQTAHGVINTPIFMPVGTAGTVKGVHQAELKTEVQAQIILGNTYHLFLRPGMDILQCAGGLHQFIQWDRPMLTDSGGYQVYSLSGMRKIKEEGVTFQSHIDGSKHTFTPENVMDIQRIIGADIIMAFDECPPYPSDYKYAEQSMHLTHRWLKRCCERFDTTNALYGHEQVLFPIVQGSTYDDLRRQSAETIASFEREGNAIGGLSVGEPAEAMYHALEVVCPVLPKDKPRYLMGVGTPVNLLMAIAKGIDMFDCVLPSRNARHGMLFTAYGIINIRNAKWKDDFSAIEENGASTTSRIHSKAYLHHLFRCKEMLGMQIATLHNLSFYLWLVGEARQHIVAGDYSTWMDGMIRRLETKL
ncbi:MAG: tRNA guanosine(34) transglycosylase Tgt [Bacteroidota bacterium]